jgi:membrane-bound lytic murein transglycosylase D
MTFNSMTPAPVPLRLGKPRSAWAVARFLLVDCGLLAGAALLAGCAHQPTHAPVAPPVVVAPTPAPPVVQAAVPSPPTDPAADTAVPAVAAATTDATVDGTGPLPGPPADSVVTVKTADLFQRIRTGFQLEDVDEVAIDRELNWFANHPDYLERTWGRAETWLYYIVGQLEARNMPRELALLPVIESAFEPYAYSRAQASGLWQFISDTGRRFGLKQDWWYDGRRDAIEATRAALDYLQELHDEFDGDWLLAIAAYNCGELAVSRAVDLNQRQGKPIDFWHLKLPTETRAYVPKLLAMARLVRSPARYGLEFSQIPNEPYFTQVATGGQIDLAVVAELAGISKDELYDLNPAYHRWATDPDGPHSLLVPIDAAPGLEETLASLTPEQRMRVEHYTVRRGDTVASIAKRFATTPAVLREINELGASDKLVVDTPLRVPSANVQLPEKAARAAMLVDNGGRTRRVGRSAVHVVRRGDTLYNIAQRLGTDVHTLAQLNGMQPSDRLRAGQKIKIAGPAASAVPTAVASNGSRDASGRRVTYTVRRGDTLYSIARVLQVTVIELVSWNGLGGGGGGAIKPGQTLVAFVKSRG